MRCGLSKSGAPPLLLLAGGSGAWGCRSSVRANAVELGLYVRKPVGAESNARQARLRSLAHVEGNRVVQMDGVQTATEDTGCRFRRVPRLKPVVVHRLKGAAW